MLSLGDFDFNLPDNLIAQKPHNPRDQARLLILNRDNGDVCHSRFDKISDFLTAGDVLVINNSKVFPARLLGCKKNSGGKIEVFLHQEKEGGLWECLIKGKTKLGLELELSKKLSAKLVKDQNDGTWLLKFNLLGRQFWQEVDKIGQVPLPPYIQPDSKQKNSLRYQTIYADEKKRGSVAAPTAGLHFSNRLLNNLKNKGIIIVPVTLHVGLGTFLGVKEKDIRKHKMHSEDFYVSLDSLNKIFKAKQDGNKVVAVGTTSCRVLESLAQDLNQKKFIANIDYQGSTNIFIYPGYKFLLVDALITNFHLPKSTLLMLVSSFTDPEYIKKAYQVAIENRYNFYSYGDAMLIA